MMQFDGPMFTDDELSCPVRAQVEALTEFRGRRQNALIWAVILIIMLMIIVVNDQGLWTLGQIFSFATFWRLFFWPEVQRARAAWDRFEEARTWSTHRRAP